MHDDCTDASKRYEKRRAVGSPVERPVRPAVWWHRAGDQFSVAKGPERPFANCWEPLYDGAAVDALIDGGAKSLTDELMDCVDRLGHEADAVDLRVWHHLLVYAPQYKAALREIERLKAHAVILANTERLVERERCAAIAAPEHIPYSEDEWRVRCEVRDAILEA
jgi:hypothetical protein